MATPVALGSGQVRVLQDGVVVGTPFLITVTVENGPAGPGDLSSAEQAVLAADAAACSAEAAGQRALRLRCSR